MRVILSEIRFSFNQLTAIKYDFSRQIKGRQLKLNKRLQLRH